MNRSQNPAFAVFAEEVFQRELNRALEAEMNGAPEAVLCAYECRLDAMRYYFFESNSDGGTNSGVEIGLHTPSSLKTGLSGQGQKDTWVIFGESKAPQPVEVKTNGGRVGSLLTPDMVSFLTNGTPIPTDTDWNNRSNKSVYFVYALFQCNSTTGHEIQIIEPRIITVNDLLKAIANNPQWVKPMGDGDWAIQPAGRGWKKFVQTLPEVWKVTNL